MYTENRARSASIVMGMCSLRSIVLIKLITLWISNKKEFNHFFKSRRMLSAMKRATLNAKRAMRMCERSEQCFFSMNRPFQKFGYACGENTRYIELHSKFWLHSKTNKFWLEQQNIWLLFSRKFFIVPTKLWLFQQIFCWFNITTLIVTSTKFSWENNKFSSAGL